MTRRKAGCRWRVYPGCRLERRLAPDSPVLCQHNRWEPAVRAMVPCEGRGQEPIPHDPAAVAAAGLVLPGVASASGSTQQARPAPQGAA